MIDYKEVRIGNLVSYEGKEYRIAGIYKDYPFLDTIEFGAGVVEWKDLEPIPLTEEWLMKFGFEYNFINQRIKQYKLNGFVYRTSKYNTSLSYKSIYNLYENIDHVHALQNLYYTLTNTEL